LGGGQPCGLAAASARGRRPPKAGGGPIKYHRLAFRNSLHRAVITSADENRRFRRIEREGLFSGPNGIWAALFPGRTGLCRPIQAGDFLAGPALRRSEVGTRGKWEGGRESWVGLRVGSLTA